MITKSIVFEMYLDFTEVRKVLEDALNILRSYTMLDNCIGAFKGNVHSSNVLRYIATEQEHVARWMKFYEICKTKLEVTNYLSYKAELRLDKNDTNVV